MTQEYQDWIDYCKKEGALEPLTRTQVTFAEYVLSDKKLQEMLAQPGDLEIVVKYLRKYLKS